MQHSLFINIRTTPLEENGHGPVYHECLKKAVEEVYISKDFGVTQSIKRRIAQFKALFKEESEAARIFFLETFTTRDFCSLIWAAFFHLQTNDQIWLLFRYGTHQLPFRGKLHKGLWKLLKWRLKGRVVGLTDSELIAEQLREQLTLLPIPHTTLIEQQADRYAPVICWWPGQPRESKGLAVIRRLAQRNETSAVAFSLMLSENMLIPQPGRLHTYALPSSLSRERYRECMLQTTCVLLPYDPVIYRSGTSGIFVETVVAGRMPIVKEGSWLAYQLKKYGLKELIVDWDRDDFFAHLKKLVDSEIVWKKLSNMQKAYAFFHCQKTYSQIIRHLCSGCS